jgi:hypothetical protein
LGLLAALVVFGAACEGVLMGDLSPLEVQIRNETESDVILLDGSRAERWARAGPAQSVTLQAGQAVERVWNPDYDHRLRGSDQFQFEATDLGGDRIFCHRYTVDELQRMRFNVPIRSGDVAC